MSLEENIAKSIEKLMKEKNLSLKELSEKSKVSCATLRKHLNQEVKNIRASTICKIVMAYDLCLDDFMGYKKEKK